MKITTDSTHSTVTRYANIEDGPVLPQAYSSSGKRFRVERIAVTYTLDSGEWKVPYTSSVTLAGTVLKKDGTDSKVYHSGGIEHRVWRNLHIDHPWLVEIIDQLRPHGVSVLFHGEFEVQA